MIPEKNILLDERDRMLAHRFCELVTDEKLYLCCDMDLWEIAKLLNTNRHNLSRAINQVLKKTFSVFIAELRVEESLKIMQEDTPYSKSKRPTIEEIAHRSGFNDRKSFFRTFKRMKGVSPSEYMRKELRVMS